MVGPAENGSICIGCGLCCDGTLHDHTRVREEDELPATAVGLAIVAERGKRIFQQPCVHFASGVCHVYSGRPPVCARYRCALLKRVDGGELSHAEAGERIATAKSLRRSVIGTAPEALTPAVRKQLARHLKKDLAKLTGEERSQAARQLLNLAALDHFLGLWFRDQPENEVSDVDCVPDEQSG